MERRRDTRPDPAQSGLRSPAHPTGETRRSFHTVAAGVVCAAVALAPAALRAAPAHAAEGLREALAVEYPGAVRAAGADRGAPEQAQRRYDAARDLQSRLPATAPRDCRPLLAALRRFAAAQVAAAEWLDRAEPARRAAAVRLGRAARARVEALRPACRGTAAAAPAPRIGLTRPGDGEAFTGGVTAAVPAGATAATLVVDGRVVASRRPVHGAAVRLRVPGRPRPIGLLEVRFHGPGGRLVAVRRAERVYLLPVTAWDAAPGADDPPLAKSLTALADGFPGISAMWLADLADGARAGWNERARFPAASTVKLGVLAAALARFRAPGPRGRVRHDLEAIARWSSNLAANRVVRLLGGGDAARGDAVVERMLRALGAASSTYTGAYRVGTGRSATPGSPPLVSRRVTTARDLGRILETLNRLAGGDEAARPRAGLRPRDARLAVGLLLRSQEAGDNAGLLAPFLPATLPRASKQGWLSSARHTAALLFGEGGPVVAVVLTYRDGLDLRQARALGRGVARVAVARAAR